MADNKDNSRADLFEILNELHNDDAQKPNEREKSNLQSHNGGSSFQSEAHVEELIKILSSRESEDDNTLPKMKSPFDGEFVAEPKEAVPQSAKTHTEVNQAEVNQAEETHTEGGESEEAEVPTAIFGHLSSEAEIASEIPLGDSPISSHFTDEVTPAPELPLEEDEEEEEDEDEDEEEDSKVKKVGRFFRGMSFIPKAVIYLVLVIVASAYLSYFIITIGNDIFALVTDSREVTIVIEEGFDDGDVAKQLEEKGVIEYGWVYKLYMKYRGDGDSDDQYILGEHVINQNFNYSQIINALTRVKTEREIKRITIPEGYTVEQIITLLVDNGIGERKDYIEAVNNYPYKWEFVQKLDEMGYSSDRIYRLEGYLYPDTYEFSTTEDEVYVINKMLNAFNDKFWREFIKTDDSGFSLQSHMLEEYGMTFDDVVVFASMVQSEGGTATDFYYISYVFHNRLDHPAETNGKLESDATIQYVLPQRVESEDLNVSMETPYNTYIHKGLPPGAISNPGSDALSAVLYPEAPKDDDDNEINAYYFVSNKAGKTYYARSKDGHERNKQRVDKDNAAIEAGDYVG